jgi:hypothetical protein
VTPLKPSPYVPSANRPSAYPEFDRGGYDGIDGGFGGSGETPRKTPAGRPALAGGEA